MAQLVVLSGAGLSKASGIPTFRDPDGLWRGHEPLELATPEAFAADPALVTAFYDARRATVEAATPNAGHLALARLQQRLGTDKVLLVTQNVDGLLEAAGAPEVVAMHGSLRVVRCSKDPHHPRLEQRGPQDPSAGCAVCGARMRPAVVWFGEVPHAMDRLQSAVQSADVFVSVGTSGVVYPAAGLAKVAKACGARTIEINPEPSGARWFDTVIAETAETALPRWVKTV